MGNVFKQPKPPTPPQVAPMPTSVETDQAGDAEVKKQRKRSGFENTLATFGNLTPKTGLKTTLG